MWLGAGWFRGEYDAYGYPFHLPKRRVDELEESVTIYKKIFTEDETNFEGKFWKLKNHRNFPKSIQKPYPQIVIGTNGERMIDIACREADGINLPYLIPRDQKKFKETLSIVHDKMQKYNRDNSEFEISLYTHITIVNGQKELEKLRKERRIFKSNLKYHFMGTIEEIKDKIKEFEKSGIEKMVIAVESPELEDPIKFFRDEIIE